MMKKYLPTIYDRLRRLPPWVIGFILALSLLCAFLLPSQERTENPAGDALGYGATISLNQSFAIFVKLSLVTLALYLGLTMIRKWKKGNPYKPYAHLTIIESIHLNPQQSLHLIQVLDRWLLIGCTNQSINCISIIEKPSSDTSKENCFTECSSTLTREASLSFPSLIAQFISKH